MKIGLCFYMIMTIIFSWIAWPISLILIVLFIVWVIASLVLGLTDGRFDYWLLTQEAINNAKEKGGN